MPTVAVDGNGTGNGNGNGSVDGNGTDDGNGNGTVIATVTGTGTTLVRATAKTRGGLPTIWLGWVSCSLFPLSYTKPIPTHGRNIGCMGKSGPYAAFKLFFLGLGWPWVGEFIDLIIFFISNPNPT